MPERHEFVYLVLSHGKLSQLVRLMGTIRAGSPNAAIVLHHDLKAALPDTTELDRLGVRLVEPRFSVQWGDTSQVDALLGSITYVLLNFDFKWLYIISGQDYPLRPLSVSETALRNSHFDAYVKATPALTWQYRARYYARYWTLPRAPYAYLLPTRIRASLDWMRRQLNKRQGIIRIEGGNRGTPFRLGIFDPRHPFSQDFVCHKGSDWFTLTRQAATYLLDFGHESPRILAHYRHTFIPSESYIQTVLWNAKHLRICDDHRRFILWNNSRLAHPLTLTMQHLDAMVASGKDFGRKFDMDVNAKILDALDQIVLQPQNTHNQKKGANDAFPANA